MLSDPKSLLMSSFVKLRNRELPREAIRYLAVGSAGYISDASIFNILSITLAWSDYEFQPLVNKMISTCFGILVTYILNSRWTFRHRRGRPESFARVLRYAVVNALGLVINLAPLFVSRYILGFESLLADNISANLIGTALALVFRFLAVRRWVFIH